MRKETRIERCREYNVSKGHNSCYTKIAMFCSCLPCHINKQCARTRCRKANRHIIDTHIVKGKTLIGDLNRNYRISLINC